MMAKKIFLLVLFFVLLNSTNIFAQTPTNIPIPTLSLEIGEAESGRDISVTLQIVILLTILTIAPSILIMMTGFTRIVIVLSFIRRALGLQTTPPNQLIVGFALFLTFFVMGPVIDEINTNAFTPLMNDEIQFTEFLEKSQKPLKIFMLRQTRERDLELFVSASGQERPRVVDDLQMRVIVPAFVLSELRRAFEIGFLIFIPFLVIDMIIASILMSMGMMMLPPTMIAMPFKIILFVLVDGWHLIVTQLLTSF